MSTTRRDFMIHTAGLATLLGTDLTLPGFLARTASASTARPDEPILVIVQMTGGNDGLNTVIPHRDDRYHAARPTLAVGRSQTLALTDDLGLHPVMTGLKSLYDDGHLGVITNVGYPNPDRSHFRSMDIWHTALATPEEAEDGWLGRVADAAPGAAPYALHIDRDALPLALRSRTRATPSIRDIASFRLDRADASLRPAIAAARAAASDDLLFVQRTALAACDQAARLQQIAADGAAGATYPQYGLANRLRQIAQLIAADFGARVYYTSLGGFDTHARQALAHGPLLRELSDSLAAFQRDLRARGLSQRVLTMTFSEFGRRVKENGSQGTDHGAAAPMFVLGDRARVGIHGGVPNLGDLDDGDVRHTTDFRDVYATLLERWLDVRHEAVLGRACRVMDLVV